VGALVAAGDDPAPLRIADRPINFPKGTFRLPPPSNRTSAIEAVTPEKSGTNRGEETYMFGQIEEARRRRRPFYVLPIALLLHLVGLVTIVSAQYWHMEAVPEPQDKAIFVDLTVPQTRVEPLPQPKPAGGPPPKGPKTETVQPPAPTPVHTFQQPTDINDLKPAEEGPKDDTPAVPGPPSPGPAGPGPVGPAGPGGPGGPGDTPGGPGGPGDSQPLHVGGAVIPPRKIESTAVKPQYTEMARRAHLAGLFVAEAIIDEQGNVTNIRVLKPMPMGLDKAAIEAMSQWKFHPATLGGRPVKVYYTLQINFQVQ
jgi:TonB family protein